MSKTFLITTTLKIRLMPMGVLALGCGLGPPLTPAEFVWRTCLRGGG